MSRDGSVELQLGGETYLFRLGIGDLEALQEATDVGIVEHAMRLHRGLDYPFAHAREIIRYALIGGGLARPEALRIARGLDLLPNAEVVTVAMLAVAAALDGAEDERLPPGRSKEPAAALPNGKMEFGPFYRAAAAIGLSLADLRAMSLWQFGQWVTGFNRSQNPNEPEPLSEVEVDQLWEHIQSMESVPDDANSLQDA